MSTFHMRTLSLFASLALVSACGSSDDSNGASTDDTGIQGSDTSSGGDTTPGGDTGKSDTATGGDTKPGDGGSDTSTGGDTTGGDTSGGGKVKTVFIILMENHSWSSITSSTSANYINKTLVPMSSYATQYYNPPGIHPSEPNYIWLEAGDNFGIIDDADPDPASRHLTTTDHLATQLEKAGVSWKAYQEDISGAECPIASAGLYAAKHDPFVFFDDTTNNISATSAHCIAHVRPYSELATDLAGSKAAQYNFITPNLCNDMHGAGGCTSSNTIKMGDTWLSTEVPKILASAQYKDGGALFVTWDESSGGDGPIGMIVVSPLAKGGGYNNTTHYDHSSTLKTMEEIFGVTLLRGAAAAGTNDLADLFKAGAI
jgi:phospholipase C